MLTFPPRPCSATGRTLPHCYLEVVDIPRATDLIARMDRTHLGDRTVRVKWERPGELMRDVRPFSLPRSSPYLHRD